MQNRAFSYPNKHFSFGITQKNTAKATIDFVNQLKLFRFQMDPIIDYTIHGKKPITNVARWENSFVLSYGTTIQAYSLFQYSTIQDLTSWFGIKAKKYEFFKLAKHFSNLGKQNNVLFFEDFNLQETEMTVKRKAYDIWALSAYLGGIVAAFSTLGFTFIVPFAKVSSQYEAIFTFFSVQ